MQRIVDRVMNYVPKPATRTTILIEGWWNAELQWARNKVSLAGDRRDLWVTVTRVVGGNSGTIKTNQYDDVSLEAAVRAAERAAVISPLHVIPQMPVEEPTFPSPVVKIWSDATANVTIEQRAQLAKQLTELSEPNGFLSAGYMEMRAAEAASFDSEGQQPGTLQYQAYTQSQCSATVRHPKGVGSGWAGLSSYDWSSINGAALVTRAVEKCQASLNPVAIEPGRYTAILEPAAVVAMTDVVMNSMRDRTFAEGPGNPWTLEYDQSLNIWRSKLGLKVIDERLSFTHDPQHAELGVLTEPGLAPISFITNGVLNSLPYTRSYALRYLGKNTGNLYRPSYTMTGGDTSMEEMISSTKRGLLVTRFWGVGVIIPNSLLCTGVTRDGLWLIENGKISKAVKNFRFTESPLFMLNQVVQIGAAERVFHPNTNPYTAALTPAIVPALKVNDFSFTSTIDAV